MRKIITIKPDRLRGLEYINTRKYNDEDILDIIWERSRFSDVRSIREKILDIPDEKFTSMFTPHFLITSDNINDAYFAMLGIYYAVTEKSTAFYGDYITSESPSNRFTTVQGGFDPLFGVFGNENNVKDYFNAEEEELLNELRNENNPVMHVEHFPFFGERDSFVDLDPDGDKLLFCIRIRRKNEYDDMSDDDYIKSESEYAKSINFVHVSCGKDSNTEKKEMLRNALIDNGFDVSGVEKQLLELTRNKDDITEYTVQTYMKSIMNTHLLNNPDSMVLSESDFSSIKVKPVEKAEVKNASRHKIVGLEREREKLNGIVKMIALEKNRKEMGISDISNGCNMVFAGSPGTAKTTLAREFAIELANLGFIKSAANFKECTKSDIVGAYVGWTAKQVDNMFLSMSRSGGGVIFFDEIYTLSEKESTCFDSEAITCIVQNMENYRENVYCIFAGYEDKMNEFLSANPGIRSRISFTIKFGDYDNEVLNNVFESIVVGNGYKLPRGFEEITGGFFNSLKSVRKSQFGNGREARNLFTNAVQKMAIRLGNDKRLTRNKLTQITITDISEAAKDILDSEIKVSNGKTIKIGF